MDIHYGVIEVLESMGIQIDANSDEIPLQEYIVDSIQFITFVVNIEEKFNIVFPDEYLLYDSISTMDILCEIIKNAQEHIDN